jgi:enamine deaminase RidA (YjgF/YER057c/UK114 family)
MSDRGETGQRILQPASWPRPRGYSNGISAAGETIFLAGQIGWDAGGKFAEGLANQVGQALTNIVILLAEAGAEPRHLVRLTWFVTDLSAYRENQLTIGTAYRRVIGKHFPTMSVIGVSQLVEQAALVEIEATAVLPHWQTAMPPHLLGPKLDT